MPRRPGTERARRIRRAAEEHPELPVAFVAGVLEGLDELEAGLAEPLDWSIGNTPD